MANKRYYIIKKISAEEYICDAMRQPLTFDSDDEARSYLEDYLAEQDFNDYEIIYRGR